jgi:hypothetical protein
VGTGHPVLCGLHVVKHRFNLLGRHSQRTHVTPLRLTFAEMPTTQLPPELVAEESMRHSSLSGASAMALRMISEGDQRTRTLPTSNTTFIEAPWYAGTSTLPHHEQWPRERPSSSAVPSENMSSGMRRVVRREGGAGECSITQSGST